MRAMPLLLPLLAVALAQPAWADPPEKAASRKAVTEAAGLAITGPARVPAYKLVRLTVTGADPEAALIWDVSPEADADVLEVDGGLIFTAPPGTYAVKLRAVKGRSVQTARHTVVVGDPAPPPPGPGPAPPNPPGPTPPPAPTSPVAYLVVVEETAEAVGTRGAFFADAALAARMKARGIKWRVIDKDVVGPDGKPPADVARFLALAAGKPYPSLFTVDAAGKLIGQQPMPRTPADLLTLLGS
jgi:hypothetical protein